MGEPNKKTQLPPLTESLLLQMLKSKDRKYFITEFDFSKYNIGLIANNLFENCNKLESVTLPDSVKTIGQGAFKNCSKLSSLNMPKSLEVIEPHAFEGCTSLSSISNVQPFVIPSNVKEIGEDAFKKVYWIHYEGQAKGSPWGAHKVTNSEEVTNSEDLLKDSNEQDLFSELNQKSKQFREQQPSSQPLGVQQQENTSENFSNELDLENKIQILEQEKAELNEQLQDVNEYLTKVQPYVDNYKNIESRCIVQQDNIKKLEADKDSITKKYHHYYGEYDRVDKENKRLQNENLQLGIEKENLEKEVAPVRNIVPVFERLVTVIEKRLDTVEKNATKFQEFVENQQSKEKTYTINRLETEKSSLQKEIRDKNLELGNNVTTIQNLNVKIQQFEKDKKDFEEKISLKENMIDSLSKRAIDAESNAKNLVLKVDDLESKNSKLYDDNRDLTTQIEHLKATHDQDLANAENEHIKQLEEQKTEFETQLEQLQKKYDEDIAKKEEELKASLSNSSEASAKLLEEQKAKFDEEISKCKADNQTLFNANNELKEQKEKVAKDLEFHQSLYADFDNLYKDYKSLPDGVKLNLQNLFGKEDNVISLVFNITKARNIPSFWQFICDRIDKNELPDQIDNLKNIFSIAFKLLQVSDPNYVLIDTKLEDGWSNIFMRKKLGSPQNGVVKEVFFKGIKYQADNRIIKQSLVLLG